MLLNVAAFRCRLRITVGSFLLCVVADLRASTGTCFAEIAVYSPTGTQLAFSVVGLGVDTGVEAKPRPNLLGLSVDGIKFSSNGSRVTFSSGDIVGKRPLRATLRNREGKEVQVAFSMTSCRRRVSIYFGNTDLGSDVNTSMVRGQLIGCTFDASWWVRSLPLFGTGKGAIVEDGYVSEDGTFEMDVGGMGVRRILIVGRGGRVIHSQTFDMAVQRDTELGKIDVHGLCKAGKK
jgi:hypothetical protein